MWKADNTYTNRNAVINLLQQYDLNAQNIPNLIKEHCNLMEDEEVEQNTGVKFPGVQMSMFYTKTYADYNREHGSIYEKYDLIVIETASQAGKFVFQYEKSKWQWGKCEFCYTYNFLKAVCACKKVAYCKLQCKENDEKYHLDKCDAESGCDLE